MASFSDAHSWSNFTPAVLLFCLATSQATEQSRVKEVSVLKRVFPLRLFLDLVMSWSSVFLLVITSPCKIVVHSARASADVDFLHKDFFTQRALCDAATSTDKWVSLVVVATRC